MADLTIKQFKGSVPRIAKHLTSITSANKAIDCKFWHGDLSSWQEMQRLESINVEKDETLILVDCCYLKVPVCSDYALGSVSCNNIYITGRSNFPEVGVLDSSTCEVEWHRLGVPCPLHPPEVLASPSKLNEDAESRVYTYQYVNSLGHRGAASPTNDPILLNEGDSVVVSGWEIPDPSWEVTKVRIYRAVSGMETGKEAANAFDSTFMFVAEVDINAGSYLDNKYNVDFAEALEEDDVTPPPEGLQGLTLIASSNALAGFAGNKLYFSRNNIYHDWSIHLTLEDNIKGIVESNGLVYVATDGAPYVVSGLTKDCLTAECRDVLKHVDSYPMIGYGNKRMARVPMGAVYPSSNGLVILSAKSPPSFLTGQLYAPDDWQKLIPEQLKPVFHSGYLYVWGDQGSFVIQMPGSSANNWEADFHSSLSDTDVLDSFETRNGYLLVIKKDGVFRWDTGVKKRPHFWQSGELVTGAPVMFGAAKIYMENGPERIMIYSDNRTIIDREVYKSEQPFMLPLWGFGSRYQIELRGTANVKIFSMATSQKELGS